MSGKVTKNRAKYKRKNNLFTIGRLFTIYDLTIFTIYDLTIYDLLFIYDFTILLFVGLSKKLVKI